MWQIVFCSHRALSRLLTHMRHGIPFPFSCLLLCSLPSRHDRAAASAIREVGRGISNCLRWLCDHHRRRRRWRRRWQCRRIVWPSFGLWQTNCLRDMCSPTLRSPLHRLFMMLLNFALKRSRKRRLAIGETSSQKMTSPPGEERLTARGDKWGQMWEVRNVSIVKINYCGFLSS